MRSYRGYMYSSFGYVLSRPCTLPRAGSVCDLLAFCNEAWQRLGTLSMEHKKGNYFNGSGCNKAGNTPNRSDSRDGMKLGNKNQPLASREPSLLPGSSLGSASRSPLRGGGLLNSGTAAAPDMRCFPVHTSNVTACRLRCLAPVCVSLCEPPGAAHCCRGDSPAADRPRYLLLWYKGYVLEGRGAPGGRASQGGPGKRRWEQKDVRQTVHVPYNWAERGKARGSQLPVYPQFCVQWLEGRRSIPLQGPDCQGSFSISPRALWRTKQAKPDLSSEKTQPPNLKPETPQH